MSEWESVNGVGKKSIPKLNEIGIHTLHDAMTVPTEDIYKLPVKLKNIVLTVRNEQIAIQVKLKDEDDMNGLLPHSIDHAWYNRTCVIPIRKKKRDKGYFKMKDVTIHEFISSKTGIFTSFVVSYTNKIKGEERNIVTTVTPSYIKCFDNDLPPLEGTHPMFLDTHHLHMAVYNHKHAETKSHSWYQQTVTVYTTQLSTHTLYEPVQGKVSAMHIYPQDCVLLEVFIQLTVRPTVEPCVRKVLIPPQSIAEMNRNLPTLELYLKDTDKNSPFLTMVQNSLCEVDLILKFKNFD